MTHKRIAALACSTLCSLCFLASPGFAQNCAVVNGVSIPSTRVDILLEELTRQGQKDTPELRAAVREELIGRELIAQEAARLGLLNQPTIKAQIAAAEQNVIIRAFTQDFLQKNPPSLTALRTQYEAAIKQMDKKEYHLHHILVDQETQAKSLIMKLKRGESFEALAKQYSQDSSSAQNGGDLDWAPLQNYVQAFSAAAAKLKPGKITLRPVHTEFGWHIIQLDEVRKISIPTFEEVKSQLVEQLQEEKLQKFEEELRSKAKIQ